MFGFLLKRLGLVLPTFIGITLLVFALIRLLPGATLFDLGNLQIELEELLGVAVDLITPGDLPARFRAVVIAQARPI